MVVVPLNTPVGLSVCAVEYQITCISFNADAQVVISPPDTSVDAGKTVLLACVAYGPSTLPSITWSRDGVTLESNDRVNFTVEELVERGLNFTKSVLEICSVDVIDSGAYSCSAGSGGNASFELTVTPSDGKRSAC